ncbi:transmembrane protein, putative [Medicago truncatula]|uniref:Transmembrane protein, putative n=1 Tax=Medicago truncatula TaxID=3880 RepID=A0A072VHL7_MEDTR|nr:transmembrane protein, putative [Medicago truncatula]
MLMFWLGWAIHAHFLLSISSRKLANSASKSTYLFSLIYPWHLLQVVLILHHILPTNYTGVEKDVSSVGSCHRCGHVDETNSSFSKIARFGLVVACAVLALDLLFKPIKQRSEDIS